jgi:hypothetical protein
MDMNNTESTYCIASNGAIHVDGCVHANRVRILSGGYATVDDARLVAQMDFERPGQVRVAPCAKKPAAQQ